MCYYFAKWSQYNDIAAIKVSFRAGYGAKVVITIGTFNGVNQNSSFAYCREKSIVSLLSQYSVVTLTLSDFLLLMALMRIFALSLFVNLFARQTFYGHTNAVNHVCCSLKGDMVSSKGFSSPHTCNRYSAQDLPCM